MPLHNQPFGATNKPGTCKWCGRALRPYRYRSAPWSSMAASGGYGDGLFCGLRCGYEFGRVLAEAGRELEPMEARR